MKNTKGNKQKSINLLVSFLKNIVNNTALDGKHSSKESQNKTKQLRESKRAVKWEDLNQNSNQLNPLSSLLSSEDVRKRIAFYENSIVKSQKTNEMVKKKLPFKKKPTLKNDNKKFKNTSFKDNQNIQECLDTAIQEVMRQSHMDFSILKVTEVKKKTTYKDLLIVHCWDIIVQNKTFRFLSEEEVKEGINIKDENKKNELAVVSDPGITFSNTNTKINIPLFTLDTNVFNINRAKKPLKYDIFLSMNSKLSNEEIDYDENKEEKKETLNIFKGLFRDLKLNDDTNNDDNKMKVFQPITPKIKKDTNYTKFFTGLFGSNIDKNKISKPTVNKTKKLLDKMDEPSVENKSIISSSIDIKTDIGTDSEPESYKEKYKRKKNFLIHNKHKSVEKRYVKNNTQYLSLEKKTKITNKNNNIINDSLSNSQNIKIILNDFIVKVDKKIKAIESTNKEDKRHQVLTKLNQKIKLIISKEKSSNKNNIKESNINEADWEIKYAYSYPKWKSFLIILRIFDLSYTLFYLNKEGFIEDIQIDKIKEENITIWQLPKRKVKFFLECLSKKLKLS